MNYLAHLYLSPPDDESLLGNLLGDFVKNKAEFSAYDKVYQGICFHRKIDQFTDTHYIFRKSRHRISEKNRRYAGIIIDIVYDHFLANNWDAYSNVPLETFVKNFYRILEKYSSILPKRLFDLKPAMIRENRLMLYRKQTGVAIALERVANRLSVPYVVDEVMAEFLSNYQKFQTDFYLFFGDVIEYAKSITGVEFTK